MEYVIPRDITIEDSNITEDDYAEYASGTTYTVDDYVIIASLHSVYKSTQGSNTGNNPDGDDGTWWTYMGATNKYKIIDKYITSQAVKNATITYTLSASKFNTIAIFNLVGATIDITTKDSEGGVVDTYSIDLTTRDVIDHYDYYFNDFDYGDRVQISSSMIVGGTVEITIDNGTSDAKVGFIILGTSQNIGETKWTPEVGITDFSFIETDDNTGDEYIVVGNYKDKNNLAVQIDSDRYDTINKQLASLRGQLVLWIGSTHYTSLVIFGRFISFRTILAGPSKSDMSLSIEGVI